MARRSKYSPEFRERCVRVGRESERWISEVARDLGVHPETLRLWVRQDEANDGTRRTWGQRQLHGRSGITPDAVSFRCLHFAYTWDSFKPEAHMIKRYAPSWNSKGFGANDPGRRRDTTNLADTHWHVRYPLDPDYPCVGVPAGQYDVLELLRVVAKQAPYWVRFQGNREGRADDDRVVYEAAQNDFGAASAVTVPRDDMPVMELLLPAVRALPRSDEWPRAEVIQPPRFSERAQRDTLRARD